MSREELAEHGLLLVGRICSDETFAYAFFHEACRPLLNNVIYRVCDGKPDYDEIVNDFYLYLKEPDSDGVMWRRLRSFRGDTSLFDWLKVVAAHRFCVQQKIKCVSFSELPESVESFDDQEVHDAVIDARQYLSLMPSARYRNMLQEIFFRGLSPEELSESYATSVPNIYSIKSRALDQLRDVVLFFRDVTGVKECLNLISDDRNREIIFSIFIKGEKCALTKKRLNLTNRQFRQRKKLAEKELKDLIFRRRIPDSGVAGVEEPTDMNGMLTVNVKQKNKIMEKQPQFSQ